MIKTTIVPQNNTYSLPIPNNYIGKEIEVLFYAKDEITITEVPKLNNAARFKGMLSEKDAAKYDLYLKKVRGEWERDI